MKYLDAAAFTRLFRARRRNHDEICRGLHVLASGVGRRLWFRDSIEREDAVANALVYAIERIDRFRFGRGRDAFSYYSSLLFNRLVNRLGRDPRAWRLTAFSDLDGHEESRGRRATCLEDAAIPYTRAG